MSKNPAAITWLRRAALLALPASVLLAAPYGAAGQSAAREARVVVDGNVERLEQPAFVEDGIYYMPVRALLTRLGFGIRYDESRGVILADQAGRHLELTPDSSIALLDGGPIHLDYPVRMVEGSAYFPSESVLELLGFITETDILRANYYVKSTVWQRIDAALAAGPEAYRLEGERSLMGGQAQVSLYLKDELIYTGGWKDGGLNGAGKVYDKGRLVYEGGLKANRPEGWGIRYDTAGVRYEGEFRSGLPQGSGRLISGSKVIYDGNWKSGRMDGSGKQYNATGKTVYEGGIVRGLREGYGVAFDDSGKMVYEGNWAAGVRAGEGKSYGTDGKVDYSGFWYKDVRHGSGTVYRYGKIKSYGLDGTSVTSVKEIEAVYMTEAEYDRGLRIGSGGKTWVYSGEFSDKGEPSGQGELGIVTGTVLSQAGVLSDWAPFYKGEFKYGKMSGTGQLYDTSGKIVYKGQVSDGKREGTGSSYKDYRLEYTGSWKSDKKHGSGWSFVPDTGSTAQDSKTSYKMTEVEYVMDQLARSGNVYKVYPSADSTGLTGTGTQTWITDAGTGAAPTGTFPSQSFAALVYSGDLVNGLREGQGTEYTADGGTYKGSFKANMREGAGVLAGPEYKYEGQFKNNRKNGTGKLYHNGTLEYAGEFENDRKHGSGVSYWNNGSKEYEGEFKYGLRDGYGILYATDGITVQYRGLFKDGEKVVSN
ncbi:stalk domain-containing protein [Gorillibacterium sp. sgz5001074]|uniref:stalk domain-containing protein n=1 Tax=Gorillibacterium sp. sgz5001074 TaxID=3446695 RepID=UPI003F669D7A